MPNLSPTEARLNVHACFPSRGTCGDCATSCWTGEAAFSALRALSWETFLDQNAIRSLPLSGIAGDSITVIEVWVGPGIDHSCPEGDLNPHNPCGSADFKSVQDCFGILLKRRAIPN